MMRRLRPALMAAIFLVSSSLFGQGVYLNRINIPDLPDYKTLKCDFHMHTVFSDGAVWPAFRVQEATLEGLDAIAITDHVEYQPKKDFVSTDHNASWRIAMSAGKEAGLVVIPGAEITRDMPPGHLNALFVKDANALVQEDWKAAVAEAHKQGALIVWNHPGWESQQPDGVARWYDAHTFLLDGGMLQGIEVVNGVSYYPEVFRWCLDKKLTLFGNTDVHDTIAMAAIPGGPQHRPMTLVFAAEKSAEAIREALLQHRTVAYSADDLYGEEIWLKQIFDRSVSFSSHAVSTIGRGTVRLLVTNNSDIPYHLSQTQMNEDIQFPKEFLLPAGKTAIFTVRARKSTLSLIKSMDVEYQVTNLNVAPDKKLTVRFTFDVNIQPQPR
jgi:3',5'-nucleoside bisphosphate phosphatase